MRGLLNKNLRNLLRSHKPRLVRGKNDAIWSKAKEFNKTLNKIGDEKTKESTNTLKALRLIGGGSIILVFCSLMWASAMSAPEPVTEVVEIKNLGKDIRESDSKS
ncbi:uncharacterized protein PRCAT00003797001 [Priceomyces carsonii]|uniref:uncharacterized protein n=1 Tax=Priceomyces carsonii TaxID=28549 RepID=UPI002ED89CE8|nr:unnamed protein product [Priceomyces carsonii]